MIIHKILNNNSAIVLEENKECVVMGKGVAFQKQKGDEIDEELITKIFTLENRQTSSKLFKLVEEIPIEYFQVAEKIIQLAQEKLEMRLHDTLYVTLSDHINFAVMNHRNHIDLKNSILWDVKRLYRKEYDIGIEALNIIQNDLGVTLIEDEAASIALHLINGQIHKDIPQIVNMMNVVQEILQIVKYTLQIDYDEDSLDYHRFITHLRFLAERIFSNSHYDGDDVVLFDLIVQKYPMSYSCSKKVKEYIKKTYGNELSNDEMIYITIHIDRMYRNCA